LRDRLAARRSTVDLVQDNAEWLFRLSRCGVSLV